MTPRLLGSLSVSVALLLGACSSTSGTTSTSDSEGGADAGSSSGGGDDSGGASSGALDGSAQDSTVPDAGHPASDAADDGALGPVGDAGVCASCRQGAVCVEHQVSGGAFITPDDAGQCPPGRVLSPGTPAMCVVEPTFQCATLPPTCSNPPGTPALAHCTCAPSLCASGEVCTDVSPTLMRCALLAP